MKPKKCYWKRCGDANYKPSCKSIIYLGFNLHAEKCPNCGRPITIIDETLCSTCPVRSCPRSCPTYERRHPGGPPKRPKICLRLFWAKLAGKR